MKIVYTSPLKSLSQERYEGWITRFPDKKVLMLTGDTLYNEKVRAVQMAKAAESDIIITTSELLDSVTRKYESEKNYWLKQVGALIVDESHILTVEGRGSNVEVGITRFSKINPKARIIFLSATMPNVGELGTWLSKLNGKDSKVVHSTWRPVELEMNYIEYIPGYYNYEMSQKKKLAVEIVKSKPEEKFLVFTHDKNTGRQIVKMLASEGIEAKFHNADLDADERRETEASFENREGGLRVLVSTSTLAWGRNLPAKNVIITGVHRGLNEVDQLDIVQMSGRAGRFGIDTSGHVYLIVPQGTTEEWKEVFRNPRPVKSVLKNHSVLAFHILAEIQNREITDAKSLLNWYSRTLAYHQGEEFTIEDAQALLDDLEKMEMVVNRNSYYALTGLGRVSSWLYISPYDIYNYYKNFSQVFESGNVDDMSIAWAMTDIPTNDYGYTPKDVAKEVEDLIWKLRNRGIKASTAAHFSLAAYKCLTGEEPEEGTLKADMRAIKYDIGRTAQALYLIDEQHAKWERKDFWKTLTSRVTYGIPEEMVELVKIPGVGGVRAKKLWDAGLHSISAVANNRSKLERVFGSDLGVKLYREAKKMAKEDNKE
jgi:helicase